MDEVASTSALKSATSSAGSSSSPTMPLGVPRRRPNSSVMHQRRASQPAAGPSHSRNVLSRSFSSSAAETDSSSGSSSEDEDWSRGYASAQQEAHRRSLDYLDLSPSLPYTLASLRTQLLAQCTQLEAKMRSLCSINSSSKPRDAETAPFYAHLEALKEDLRRLALLLPRYPVGGVPSISPQKAGAAIVARSQTLAADWERMLSQARLRTPDLQQHLKIHLPTLTLSSVWPPLSLPEFEGGLPVAGARVLLEKVQARYEALHDAVNAMTLRDCFYWGRGAEGSSPSTSTSSAVTSAPALSRQLEAVIASLREKGDVVRQTGRARANSMVRVAKDAEEVMYAAAVELARGGQKLIRYEHLPELWKNNEHILSGYRFIPIERWGALLRSTFEVHNETGNILTHLIGALIVIPLFWPSKERDAAYADEATTPMDRMVQTIYLIAALKCLLLSVSWHVMAGCSDACWFERFACVDYTGIAWLVAASVWTLVYNAFYCQPNLAMFYSLTTLVVGAVGAAVPWAAWFNERQNKGLRIAVFLTMCFTALAPFTHASISHGFWRTFHFFSPILPSCACYVGGLIFYATQIPERFAPGKFDLWGHAHQIWHISIVLAILLHYRATFMWHDQRFAFSCAASPDQGGLFDGLVPPHITESSSAGILLDSLSRLSHSAMGSSVVEAASDLSKADEVVHDWRRAAGRLAGGYVGLAWDWTVERLMSLF